MAQSAAMLPPVYYSSNSEDYLASHPVGSGPYTLVDYARDDHTTLAANPNYWGIADVQRHAAGADRHLPTGARRRDARVRPAQRHGRHDLRRLARRHRHAARSLG